MKLIIDDADVSRIKEMMEYFPIDGVTTNPSILAKTGRKPYEVLQEIRELIGNDAELHVQAVCEDAEGMVKEAHVITERLGNNTYIKIPAVKEGFKAIRILHAEGIHTTATCIYTPMQAYLGGKAGADYVAPYVNRIDNLQADGVGTVKIIQDIFTVNHMHTEVLAASFKNSMQVMELCRIGIGAATLSIDVLEKLAENASVDAAAAAFLKDFEKLCGKGSNMTSC